MIKAFFQAILILTCLSLAAGLGFFAGVHTAPYVKSDLVNLSDVPPELAAQLRDPQYKQREIDRAAAVAPTLAATKIEAAPNECVAIEDVSDRPDPDALQSEDGSDLCPPADTE